MPPLNELADHSFDLVVSIFRAMFAPKPNDPTLVAQILKISSAYSPPPPEGFISPMTWGIKGNVIERFAAAGVPAEKIFSPETRAPSTLLSHRPRPWLISEPTTGPR
jgi:hypothetical protein